MINLKFYIFSIVGNLNCQFNSPNKLLAGVKHDCFLITSNLAYYVHYSNWFYVDNSFETYKHMKIWYHTHLFEYHKRTDSHETALQIELKKNNMFPVSVKQQEFAED